MMKIILEKLLESEKLTEKEAFTLIQFLSHDSCSPAFASAVMTVYRMRNITLEELTGFRNGIMEQCKQVNLSEFDPVDVCGTGGDQKNTFNISTLSAFVLAGAGIKVAKHGNNGVSGFCGSSTVLERLGVRFTNKESVLKKQMERSNICFMHAPDFHGSLKNVASVRKDLGVRTFFNMLGPMINPSSPKKQMIGVYSLELARRYAYFFQQLKKEFVIVHSLDGYDEISLTGSFKYFSSQAEKIGDSSLFGLSPIFPQEIEGGKNQEESAAIFMSVLAGSCAPAQKNVVCANAAMAIHVCYPELNMQDSFLIAKESLESGKAKNAFDTFLNCFE